MRCGAISQNTGVYAKDHVLSDEYDVVLRPSSLRNHMSGLCEEAGSRSSPDAEEPSPPDQAHLDGPSFVNRHKD